MQHHPEVRWRHFEIIVISQDPIGLLLVDHFDSLLSSNPSCPFPLLGSMDLFAVVLEATGRSITWGTFEHPALCPS